VECWKFSRFADGALRDIKEIKFSRSWRIDDPPDGERRVALKRVVELSKPDLVHVRHLIGNHPSIIARLKSEFDLPVMVSIHDHYSICPTIQLFDDEQQFCEGFCTASNGECQVSRRWFRKIPPLKHNFVHAWRETIGMALAQADALIVTSHTTMKMVRRHHPFLRYERFHLLPHGRDLEGYGDVFAVPDGERMKVVFFGALGPGKGTHFVHEMLKLNSRRGNPVELHILGDSNLPFSPEEYSVIHHGTYEREELPRLLANIGPAVSILPTVGPETYCHALTEAWACGIPVLGSTLGAVGERLQAGGGWVLPPTDPLQWLDKLTELAADPAELRRQHQLIQDFEFPTVEEMAHSYFGLYLMVLNKHQRGGSFIAPSTPSAAVATRAG
jgi:glycosyltransferase involved in cell wall biosynthesis